ncbi:MAG TPA: DMT family transporter [Candidatus Limnocylindrales bacterium]|nr:DMT family transporter [Candidatus Limnocylindrales bacterium]
MIRRSISRRDLGALFLAATCWGLGTVISKAALDEIPPLSLLAIQLATSLVVLTAIMWRGGIPLRGDGPALLGRLGFLNPGVAYALSLVGLVTITASLSVLLWALEPLMILFLAAIFLRERVTPGLVALSLLAVAGMVVVVYEPTMGTSHLVGVALTLAGIACCAAYTVITRRFIPEARETSQVVLAQQAHALALALVAVATLAIVGAAVAPIDITPVGLASAIGSGALYYAGAYWFYLDALRRVPASLAAASFYLIPIIGVGASVVLLDEQLGPSQWIGAAIVLAAVLAILVRAPASTRSTVQVAPRRVDRRGGGAGSAFLQGVGRDQPAERALTGVQRALDLDPRQRTLAHRNAGGSAQHQKELAEVRIVADQHRPIRIAGVTQDRVHGLKIEGTCEALVLHHRHIDSICNDLGGLRGAQLRRRDDRLGLEPDRP